jgi:cytochrome c
MEMTRQNVLPAGTLMLALALAACGEGGSPTPPAAETAQTPSTETAAPSVPALTLADLPAPYSEADLERGKAVFAKCRNCHSLVAAEGARVGPNLHGVFERPTASAEGFRYSPALADWPEEVWRPDLLEQWLEKPKDFLPGSSMFFNGIDDADDRRDVIAFLLIETRR